VEHGVIPLDGTDVLQQGEIDSVGDRVTLAEDSGNLPRPARKAGGLFQTTGLLEEELFQLRHLGIIEGGGASDNRRWSVDARRSSAAVCGRVRSALHQASTAAR
jgi:hypothetical protein